MKYLTHSVRDLSPQALIEILVNRIELYDDEIWFGLITPTATIPRSRHGQSGFSFARKLFYIRYKPFYYYVDYDCVTIVKTPYKSKTRRFIACFTKGNTQSNFMGSTGHCLVDSNVTYPLRIVWE